MIALNTPAELRLAAIFLEDLARLRDGPDAAEMTEFPTLDAADPAPAPEPAPAPPAPEPAPIPIPAAPTSGGLDASGLPWDARIHSETRSVTASGLWRQRRGLNDAAAKAAVEAELRAGLAGITPVAVAAPPAPEPAAPVAAPMAAPPAPEPAVPTTLPALMSLLTPRMVQGYITMSEVIAVCAKFGLSTLRDLDAHPQHIPSVWDALNG